MTIENYTDLRTIVAQWLNRDDLTHQIPVFIDFAEARINRLLRVREMIVRARAVLTDQFIPYPRDWLRAKNIQRVSDHKPLGMMSLEEMDEYRHRLKAGVLHAGREPEFFAEQGTALEVAPTPSDQNPAELEMTYYAAIPSLTATLDESNWLLRDHPDIYLYNTLIHSAPFLMADERVPVWQALADQAIHEANQSAMESRYSGAPMVKRTKGWG